MGRLFVESLSDDAAGCAVYACACGAELASGSALVWEGFMGDAVPALLFRTVVNTAPCGAPRTETLSSGRYELVDVACRACGAALGWRYLRADAGAEKYKEGALLLGRGRLRVAPASGAGASPVGATAAAAAAPRIGRLFQPTPPRPQELDSQFWDSLRRARARARAAAEAAAREE